MTSIQSGSAQENSAQENSAQTNNSLLSEFKPYERLLLFSIIIWGVVLRILWLDLRGLHHDESLHMMYSLYILDNPDLGFYKYDPMLHGPLLYNLQRFVFQALGVSFVSLRILPAILGCIFVVSPLLFRRHLSKAACLALCAAIACSPTLIYWSRFLRHDSFVFLGMLISLVGVALARPKYKALVVCIGLLLQCTAKENCYVSLALLIGYFSYEYVFLKLARSKIAPLFSQFADYCLKNIKHILFAILIFLIFYAFLYTGGFRYLGDPDGGFFEKYFGAIYDAVYRKSIGYWLAQHQIERIKGPFLFHFYLLGFYETFFILAYFGHFIIFIAQAKKSIKILGLSAMLIYLCFGIYYLNNSIADSSFTEYFKLKNGFDIFGFFVLAFHAVLVTSDHLLKGQRNLAFWGYAFGATFFTYSFLNEKVPWLSTYPLVFGLIYLTLFYDRYFRDKSQPIVHIEIETIFYYLSILLGALGLIFILEQENPKHSDYLLFYSGGILAVLSYSANRLKLLGRLRTYYVVLAIVVLISSRAAILSNFVYPGHPNELLSQVHTTPEFDQISRRIRLEIESLEPGFKPSVLSLGDSTWPLTAYFNNIDEFEFQADVQNINSYAYIFDDYNIGIPELPPGYNIENIPLRGWWVPDYSLVSIRKIALYTWNHTPWNPPGFTYITFATKKDFYKNRNAP